MCSGVGCCRWDAWTGSKFPPAECWLAQRYFHSIKFFEKFNEIFSDTSTALKHKIHLL